MRRETRIPRQRHRHRSAGPADQLRSQGHRRCVVRPSQEAARCDRGPRRYTRSYRPDTRHRTGAEGSRHCRAPPSYGDVLGPRRFDGTLREHGPGGPTRTWACLSLTKRRYNYFRQVTKAWFDNEGRRSVDFQTGGLRISAGGARADGELAEARCCRPVTGRTHGSSGSPRVHAYFVSPNRSHLPPVCRWPRQRN